MKLFFKYILVFLLIISICPVILAGNDVILNQNLEYINASLPDVIRDLAEIGGFRVILDRQVRGEVSLTLMHGVAAKEAIGTVARGYGYSSRWINASALMVGTSAFINGNFAARSTRINTLKNADPVLVAEKLQTIIPQERIKINYGTKELTVTADIAEHQNISELVNRLDRPNSPINLEILIEELPEILWKELQLETDLRSTELGASILNIEQQKLLQENANLFLLGKSDLTCFNNQKAKVLVGDYHPKSAQPNSGNTNKLSVEELESGTRLVLTPSMTNEGQLQLKINTSVKMIADQKQTLIREIQSLIGMNIGETVLFNGVMQRDEYFNLKKTTTGNQYPILENLFEKKIASDSGQSARIILLITPRLADGNEKAKIEKKPEPSPVAANQNNTTENNRTELPPTGSSIPNETGMNTAPTTGEPMKPEEEKPVVIFNAVVVPENQQPDKVKEVTVEPNRNIAGLFDVKYTVKKGDTPISIARKYGVELSAILTKNKLSNSDVIKVGSVLVVTVPSNRVYVVKSKETLWRIAKRYGLPIEVLMDLNGIDDQTKVKEGQALVLPISNMKVANPQF